MTQHVPITAIVPTGNRKDVIEDCLRSVRWADELLVVDSFSSDGSLEIAQRYADQVLQHEYINSALQKNWAIPQATHEWILLVDTDERVSEALRDEVRAMLASGTAHAGFRIPRVNYFLGEPIYHTGYYPDYQVRLFRRDSSRYELRHVHAHVLLDGSCGTLQAPIVHYAHQSLDQTIKNLLVLMTTWEAEQRALNAEAKGQRPIRHLSVNLLARPVAAFMLRYFRQGGWRDGYRGLILSLLWAMYVCITYMKVWEQNLALEGAWWETSWRRPHGPGDGREVAREEVT